MNRSFSEEVMGILNKINAEGTTIMLVTHDMRVAAKCSRILYIVDGKIKGELELGKIQDILEDIELRDRERKVNNWLADMGW